MLLWKCIQEEERSGYLKPLSWNLSRNASLCCGVCVLHMCVSDPQIQASTCAHAATASDVRKWVLIACVEKCYRLLHPARCVWKLFPRWNSTSLLLILLRRLELMTLNLCCLYSVASGAWQSCRRQKPRVPVREAEGFVKLLPVPCTVGA